MELSGMRVAVLAEDIYEDLELWYPKLRLTEAGATVHVLGTGKESYQSKRGYEVLVDGTVDVAKPEEYSAVIIPGGYAPDKMRAHEPLVEFVRAMNAKGRLVAYICHAGWVAASAGIVSGRKLTSFWSIKDDMIHAGADWVDEEVVRDGNLISSRVPSDLPAFCREIIGALSEA